MLTNETYTTVQGVALHMDVYYPTTIRPLMPVLFYVHGGSWQGHDKTEITQYPQYQMWLNACLAHGYAVFSMDYRLAPTFLFPAQIDDVRTAVRYVAANAQRYAIDPSRMGVMGTSVGGHLAALLGLAPDPTDSNAPRMRAVVDMFGISDLTVTATEPSLQQNFAFFNQIIATATGVPTGQTSPILTENSPVTYVSASAPPFLIMHGTADTVVPFDQSQELADKLQTAGASVVFTPVTNGIHGLFTTVSNQSPADQAIGTAIADFLDQHMQ